MTTRESELRISATEFKATCLELLDRLSARKLTRLIITKRGTAVAIVRPVDATTDAEALFGCLKGAVRVPRGSDLTAPVLDEPLFAVKGRIHE
ncbi:MAG TPA: prevent-host-death protein [Alphaproteobacteria bacterium]